MLLATERPPRSRFSLSRRAPGPTSLSKHVVPAAAPARVNRSTRRVGHAARPIVISKIQGSGPLVNRRSPRSLIARSDGVSGKGPHSRSAFRQLDSAGDRIYRASTGGKGAAASAPLENAGLVETEVQTLY